MLNLNNLMQKPLAFAFYQTEKREISTLFFLHVSVQKYELWSSAFVKETIMAC